MAGDIAGQLIALLGNKANVIALGNVGGGAIAVPAGSVAGAVEATLTANVTATFPAPVAGASGRVILTQDGTGSRTLALAVTSGSVLFPTGGHTLSTAAGSVDLIQWWSDGTNIFCELFKAYA